MRTLRRPQSEVRKCRSMTRMRSNRNGSSTGSVTKPFEPSKTRRSRSSLFLTCSHIARMLHTLNRESGEAPPLGAIARRGRQGESALLCTSIGHPDNQRSACGRRCRKRNSACKRERGAGFQVRSDLGPTEARPSSRVCQRSSASCCFSSRN